MQPGIHCLVYESKCVWKWKIPTSAITLTVSWETAATYLIAAMNYEGQRERAVYYKLGRFYFLKVTSISSLTNAHKVRLCSQPI